MGFGIVCLLSWIDSCFLYEDFHLSLNEGNGFRNQCIHKDFIAFADSISPTIGIERETLLALLLYRHHFTLDQSSFKRLNKSLEEEELKNLYVDLSEKKQEELERLVKGVEAVWRDIQYFPVPLSKYESKAQVHFDNSWMFERSYGGHRGHEGTDLMANINKRGYYPIVSMTDGVIENIGWLNQGGYRIGIRSPHGGYFYYAHLDSYAEPFSSGTEIKAGQLIGFMGDSGYGTEEGTVGMFDVHLHVGIYIKTEKYKELSVNPYWILKYLEDRKLTYIY